MSLTQPKPLLFCAVNQDGKEVFDFKFASSNKAAYQKLSDAGFTNIRFYADVGMLFARAELKRMSDVERQQTAKSEISQQNPSLGRFALDVLFNSRYLILLGVIVASWGIYASSNAFLIVGLLISVFQPLVSFWMYRYAAQYDRCLSAFAIGNLEAFNADANKLRNSQTDQSVLFDLDVKEATLLAKYGRLPKALYKVNQWRRPLSIDNPGLFESRVASIHLAAGSKLKCLELMRRAAEISNSPMHALDYALMEAKYGSEVKAAEILRSIPKYLLPVFAKPFIDWINALCSIEEDPEKANEKFTQAISGFQSLPQPAALPSLSVCLADFFLSQNNRLSKEQYMPLLIKLMPVIRVHLDQEGLDKVEKECS